MLRFVTTAQIVFAVLGAVLTATALGWGIFWAIRSFGRQGHVVSAELGQGTIDEDGVLQVFFQDGRSKLTRVNGDPWKHRDNRQPATPARSKSKGKGRPRQRIGGADFGAVRKVKLPVNAIFVRNSGRTAVTVTRCFYSVDLGELDVDFEPQPHTSPWGDLLPKRIEAGDEALVVHEKLGMREFLNGLMREHGVVETVYYVTLDLGTGKPVAVVPPIGIQATMTDAEWAEVQGRMHREEFDEPRVDPPRRRILRSKRGVSKAILETDVNPDQLCRVRNPEGT